MLIAASSSLLLCASPSGCTASTRGCNLKGTTAAAAAAAGASAAAAAAEVPETYVGHVFPFECFSRSVSRNCRTCSSVIFRYVTAEAIGLAQTVLSVLNSGVRVSYWY